MLKAKILRKAAGIAAAITLTAAFWIPAGKAWAAYTLLKVGSRGQDVVNLQQELKNQGFFEYPKITGYYGWITRNSVINFQKANGLAADGIAGNATLTALYHNSTQPRVLQFGMSGSAVKKLQDALKQKGYFYANSTGYYGKITERSVINFQRDYGLIIDGIAGPQTQNALYGTASVMTASVSRGEARSTKVQNDIYWLARIIHAEARGEPYLGKVAVGNVILNRVKSSGFPNTIYNVIFEYSGSIPQFSPVADGSIYNTPNGESYRAAEEAYNGSKPVGNALFFFNPSKAQGSWIVKNRRYMTTIGNHAFYY